MKKIKHYCLVLVALLTVLSSCSREKTSIKKLIFKDLNYYLNGKLYSGEAYTFYDDGNIESSTLISNGVIINRKNYGYANDLICESKFYVLNSSKHSMLIYITEKEGDVVSKYVYLYYGCKLSAKEEKILTISFLSENDIDGFQLFNASDGKPCN